MSTATSQLGPLPSLDAIDAELAARSLRDFIPMAWPAVEQASEYQPNWHNDAICDHLEACTRGEIRRLIINLPPRMLKSRLVSVMWPAWVWLRQPEKRFLFGSYSGDLARDHSVDCRTIIESRGGREQGGTLIERVGYQGLLRLLGLDWALTGDMNLKTRFTNSARGYRMATSVTAVGTGFGGDFLVADDPHSAEQGHSDIERARGLRWWDGTISSRQNDPRTGVKIVIMQRLHEQDLTGHLLAKDAGYVHLCLPMEYEPTHPFAWPDDPRTEPGELLMPQRFGPPEVAEIAAEMGSYAAAGQLQQRPAPAEGGIFKTAWWRYYDKTLLDKLDELVHDGHNDPGHDAGLPHFTRLVQSWDTPMKEKTTSDFAVGQLWGVFGPDWYLLRQVRGRWGLTEIITQAQGLHDWAATRWPKLIATVLVENRANGPEVIAALRRRIQGVLPVNPSTDKINRAEGVTPALASGNVFVPGDRLMTAAGWAPDPTTTPAWVQDLLTECASFPNGANDDQVDALTQALDPRRARGPLRKRGEPKARPVTAGLRRSDV